MSSKRLCRMKRVVGFIKENFAKGSSVNGYLELSFCFVYTWRYSLQTIYRLCCLGLYLYVLHIPMKLTEVKLYTKLGRLIDFFPPWYNPTHSALDMKPVNPTNHAIALCTTQLLCDCALHRPVALWRHSTTYRYLQVLVSSNSSSIRSTLYPFNKLLIRS